MKVAFYKNGETYVDWIIRVATQSQYSHCEIVFSNDVWFSSAHAYGGVYFNPTTPDGTWDTLNITIKDEVAALYYAEQMVGMKYDYWGIFRIATGFGPNDLDRWFCSEICAYVLKIAGVKLDLEPHNYSPGSLYRELRLKH